MCSTIETGLYSPLCNTSPQHQSESGIQLKGVLQTEKIVGQRGVPVCVFIKWNITVRFLNAINYGSTL